MLPGTTSLTREASESQILIAITFVQECLGADRAFISGASLWPQMSPSLMTCQIDLKKWIIASQYSEERHLDFRAHDVRIADARIRECAKGIWVWMIYRIFLEVT